MNDTPDGLPERSPARFFFETGYFAAYAQASIRAGNRAPFELTDAVIDRAWETAPSAHPDPEEFDWFLEMADRSGRPWEGPPAPALDRYYLVGTDNWGDGVWSHRPDPTEDGQDHGAVEYIRSELAAGETFLSQLRRVNTDRYQAWVGDGQDAGILFDAAELGGEVGELLNAVKKLEREDRGWRGSRAAPGDFADECADVLICLDKLARRKGVDLAAATVAKFNATSEKVGLPHRLFTPRANADEPVLIERRADAECGCPEELWEAYGAHLHMHLNAGSASNAHADFGDGGEVECEVTAATVDLARAAFFGWAKGLCAAKPNNGGA